MASSQGDFSYALYNLNNKNDYIGSFVIEDNLKLGIDGTEETDGLAVSSSSFGKNLTKGLLVVQDGVNTLPDENQNFKLVPWQNVEKALLKN